MSEERLTKRSYNPCDECNYAFHRHNQESGMCKLCEFKSYINLEEQGLLLRLPCRVGDTVYILGDTMAVKSMCKGFEMRNNDWRVVCSNTGYSVTYERFESVFLTQSEAEEKLRELEGK